jgi:RNA-directed DNA polymerase
MKIGNRKWQFFGRFNDGKTILLSMFGYFQIKHHRLINGAANPFDKTWDVYFVNRLKLKYVE